MGSAGQCQIPAVPWPSVCLAAGRALRTNNICVIRGPSIEGRARTYRLEQCMGPKQRLVILKRSEDENEHSMESTLRFAIGSHRECLHINALIASENQSMMKVFEALVHL